MFLEVLVSFGKFLVSLRQFSTFMSRALEDELSNFRGHLLSSILCRF